MARQSWTPISSNVAQPILASGCTRELARIDWLPWAQAAPQFRRLWAYRLGPGEVIPSIHTSADVVARVTSERYDSRDTQPLNYNWYSIVQTSDGAFYQSGPHSDVDFGHHLSEPVSDVSLGISR